MGKAKKFGFPRLVILFMEMGVGKFSVLSELLNAVTKRLLICKF